MPDALDKLVGLALIAIEEATDALAETGDVEAWRAAMERAITTAHTAAAQVAAEESGTPVDRAALAAAVAGQLAFLAGFVAAVRAGGLSPAQIAARAAMYGPAVRPYYYAARWDEWDVPPDLLPGNQRCLSNCRCRISDVRDNGDGTGTLTRVMTGDEHHCTECPKLVGDHIVKRRRA